MYTGFQKGELRLRSDRQKKREAVKNYGQDGNIRKGGQAQT